MVHKIFVAILSLLAFPVIISAQNEEFDADGVKVPARDYVVVR